jgi:hypothetical protein
VREYGGVVGEGNAVRNTSVAGNVDRILGPTDRSDCSEKAAWFSGRLAKKLSAKVHVRFVPETDFAGPRFTYILDEAVARKALKTGKERAGQGSSVTA